MLTLVFVLVRIVPGDPAQLILGDQASREAIEALRHRLGLDLPIGEQYVVFLAGALRGDWGVSMVTGQPVIGEVLRVLPWTIELTVVSLILGIVIGVPPASMRRCTATASSTTPCASRRCSGCRSRRSSRPSSCCSCSRSRCRGSRSSARDPEASAAWYQSITLPAVSLGLITAAYITRVTRSAMLEVLSEDYMRTARAKGVPWKAVVWRHALRNALIPIITVVGLYLGILIGNSVLTEIVFNRPGLGKLLIGALNQRDYTMLQGMMVIYTLIVVLVNLLTDLAYGFVDPRVKLQMSATQILAAGPRCATPLAYFAAQTFKAFNANKTSWIGLAALCRRDRAGDRAPVLSPFDPNDQNIMEKLRPPSVEHWLGTDSFGRDILSRILYGARISLVIGIVSTLAAMVIGRRSACSPASTAAASIPSRCRRWTCCSPSRR